MLYSAAEIRARVNEMGRQITANYQPKETLFVSLLNGAVPFTALLMDAIYQADPDFQPNVQYMKVSRYGDSREAGELKLLIDLPPEYHDLKGRTVILLDDLVDGGATLQYAQQHLSGYSAARVDCVVLVKKQKALASSVGIAMYGFEAPDEWLVGMGMDDANVAPEANRWAPWIAVAGDIGN